MIFTFTEFFYARFVTGNPRLMRFNKNIIYTLQDVGSVEQVFK